MGTEGPRRKVTLAWNGEDVAAAMQTLFEKGDPAKYIDLPLSNYATWPNDKLLLDSEQVGVSTFSGYSYNERSMLSLGVVNSTSRSVPRSPWSGARRTAAPRSRGRAPPPGRAPRDRQPVPVLGGRPHRYAKGSWREKGDRLGEGEQRVRELVRRGEIWRVVAIELDHAPAWVLASIRRWSAVVNALSSSVSTNERGIRASSSSSTWTGVAIGAPPGRARRGIAHACCSGVHRW